MLAIETTDQTIATGAAQAITFNDTDVYDTDGYHDTSSNTSKLVVPTGLGGYYRIYASLRPADTTSTYMQAQIRVNGTTVIQYSEDIAVLTGAGSYRRLQPDVVLSLSVTDYVELMVNHGSGGNEVIKNSFSTGSFGMYLVGVV